MAIRNTSIDPYKNTSRLSGRDLSSKFPESWIRNPSWPVIDAAIGSLKSVGLYAIFPEGGNFITVNAAGNFRVDFGDGNIVDGNNGITVHYEYDYNNSTLDGTDAPVTLTSSTNTVNRNSHGYSNGMAVNFYNLIGSSGINSSLQYYVINSTPNSFQISLSPTGTPISFVTDGTANLLPYKIAIVTVTPRDSTLTSLRFSFKHNKPQLVNNYKSGWLDIVVAISTLQTLTFSTTVGGRHAMIERFRLLEAGGILDFSSLFSGCYRLQKVEIAPNIKCSTVNSMFNTCIGLKEAPFFDTSSATNAANMFNSCYILRYVPPYDLSLVTSTSNMFSNCYELTSVPFFNTSNVENMSNMFSSCYALEYAPQLDTSKATDMTRMFQICNRLKSVPLYDTSNATNFSNMFLNCYQLSRVPLFNTSKVTNMSGMFSSCWALESVPHFDTSSVTDMSSMFSGCNQLKSVPLFDTSKVTTMASMFNGCRRLLEVPAFNTPLLTNINFMLGNCTTLQKVPLFNTSLVTNAASFITNDHLLDAIPAFDLSSISSSVNALSLTNTFISRVQFTGQRFSFSVANNKLSADALNEIYTNLPTVTGQTITVSGNYGVTSDNPAIATAKGWTVSG